MEGKETRISTEGLEDHRTEWGNSWKPMMIGAIVGGILVMASFGTFMLLSTDDDRAEGPNGIRLYNGFDGFYISVDDDLFWIMYYPIDDLPEESPKLYIASHGENFHDEFTTLVPALYATVEVFGHKWTFVEIDPVEEYIVVEVH